MQDIEWQITGIDCTSCAATITNYLQKQQATNIYVNPITGATSFTVAENNVPQLKKGIEQLGYGVAMPQGLANSKTKSSLLHNNKRRLLFCLPFMLVLMLHMLAPHSSFLNNPVFQLIVCLPVFAVGMYFFGKSALKSLQNKMPNMNVLISLGAIAAFLYSVIAMVLQLGHGYLFFETTASIITLVFLGNYLEEVTMKQTQKATDALTQQQVVMANMIAFDDEHQEQIFAIESQYLKIGDLVLIKTGEQVPVDCKILWGTCQVNEALLAGESGAIEKFKKDNLIGGSTITQGTVKAQVTAVGKQTVLSNIVQLAQQAQMQKAPLQLLADKISAIFVPTVLVLALLTFLGNYFLLHITAVQSLLRSIAVLVIACPCAMGLATPAAIAVGLSRGLKSGVIFKNTGILEKLAKVKQLVFDKTGTLTTGKFSIQQVETSLPQQEFETLVYNIEKYSQHPMASAFNSWKTNQTIFFKQVDEVKGKGMQATLTNGDEYKVGNAVFTGATASDYNIFVTKNNTLLGCIKVDDSLQANASKVVNWAKKNNIATHIISGDNEQKVASVAAQTNIASYYHSQLPAQKLGLLQQLKQSGVTAMVGDGINDAPALAAADIGVAVGNASQLAVLSADVVLLNNDLQKLPFAVQLGAATSNTIQQNLFWAFAYNIIAIPVAAFGWLTPTVAALVMACSDVFLVVNSLRLHNKKFNNE
jgi:P-type Cu+ transporter